MRLRALSLLLALASVAHAASPGCPAMEGAVATARTYVDGGVQVLDCEYVEAGDLPWPVGRLRLLRLEKGRPATYSDLCTGFETSAGEQLVHGTGKAALVRVRLHDGRDVDPWLAGARGLVAAAKAVACPKGEAPVTASSRAPTRAAAPVAAPRILDPPPARADERLLPLSKRKPALGKRLYTQAENTYYGRNGKTKNHKAALALYKQAGKHGHGDSLYSVAYMLRYGQGATKDETAAVRWGVLAASVGNGPGAGLVGDLYYFGRGVPKSFETSVHWYKKGVAAGHASSNYSMGFMYEHGQGVAKNMVMAARYYKTASDKGNRNGMFELACCMRDGQGTSRNIIQARKLFEKAVKKGHNDSKAALAAMLEKGQGGGKDLRRARQLYQQAAKGGNAAAKKWLAAH